MPWPGEISAATFANNSTSALTTLIYSATIARRMSDIRINLPQDPTVIILKRIQSKISGYKGYKEGGDLRVPTQALFEDIEKRLEISITNFRAALDNLEMYEKFEEKKVAEQVFNSTADLTKIGINMPSEPVLIPKEEIEKYYFSDEKGFKNSVDILDNINSFRSASISGVSDNDVLEKIKANLERIKSYLLERNELLTKS